MSPIEIGPDGSPIVTPDSSSTIEKETDFVVEGDLPESPMTTPSTVIPPEATIEQPKVKEPLVGTDARIEDAKKFNQKLHDELHAAQMKGNPVVEGKEETSTQLSTLEEIELVLKEKGMDSQQRNQAMAAIGNILGGATVNTVPISSPSRPTLESDKPVLPGAMQRLQSSTPASTTKLESDKPVIP
jgi:hypothetical protein